MPKLVAVVVCSRVTGNCVLGPDESCAIQNPLIFP